MGHKIILALIFLGFFTFCLFKVIKNKPEYLLLLGIRGLFSLLFIQFINYLCSLNQISSVVAANPVSLATGAFLGIPGIVLLYASKIYLL